MAAVTIDKLPWSVTHIPTNSKSKPFFGQILTYFMCPAHTNFHQQFRICIKVQMTSLGGVKVSLFLIVLDKILNLYGMYWVKDNYFLVEHYVIPGHVGINARRGPVAGPHISKMIVNRYYKVPWPSHWTIEITFHYCFYHF